MKKQIFLTNIPSRPGEMAIVTYDEFANNSHPYFDVWDEEGWYTDLTTDTAGITLEKDEVAINHDLYFQGWLKDLCDYIADSVREVTFGRFGTKTKVIKLKPNWKELCIILGSEE